MVRIRRPMPPRSYQLARSELLLASTVWNEEDVTAPTDTQADPGATRHGKRRRSRTGRVDAEPSLWPARIEALLLEASSSCKAACEQRVGQAARPVGSRDWAMRRRQ